MAKATHTGQDTDHSGADTHRTTDKQVDHLPQATKPYLPHKSGILQGIIIQNYNTAYCWVPQTPSIGHFTLTHSLLDIQLAILAHAWHPYRCHDV